MTWRKLISEIIGSEINLDTQAQVKICTRNAGGSVEAVKMVKIDRLSIYDRTALCVEKEEIDHAKLERA